MHYFAYGANMDPVHLQHYCPGALVLGPAILPEHRFQIAARGYGHAAPAPGFELPGILWELPANQADALDGYEGVPEGWYRRELRMVRGRDGSTEAMLYLAADPTPGLANPGYLEAIIPVAERSGFPAAYVAGLKDLQRQAAFARAAGAET